MSVNIKTGVPGSQPTADGTTWAGLTFGALAVDGRFQIEGLEPGEYGVSAFLGPNRVGVMVHG